MVPADLPLVASMVARWMEDGLPAPVWTPRALRRHFLASDVTGWALPLDGGLAGALMVRAAPAVLHVDVLVVDVHYRRRGIGAALLGQAHGWAVASGLACELLVREGNRGAQRFYQRMGYAQLGRLPAHYCGRETAIRMTHNPGLSSADG